jgi:hypothetical protein
MPGSDGCLSERGQAHAFSQGQVSAIMAQVMSPEHFFVGESAALAWQRLPFEEEPWEVFNGRLLDLAHTRASRAFASWNVLLVDQPDRPGKAVLSLKLDAEAGQVHVVRSLLCHVWEGYNAGDNVYLSREVTRWVRELVGSVELAHFRDADQLRGELAGLLFRAVIGASRLPLTSVEAPLPAFSLGQWAYFFRTGGRAGPLRSWYELIEHGLQAEQSWLVKAKLLELLLRAVPAAELGEATARFVGRWQALGQATCEMAALLRTVFNEVALSPYTDFVDKGLAFVQHLVDNGPFTTAMQVDFLGHLLRQLGRHLTAYDLVTFHHRGANYPDALLLDAVLKTYLGLAECRPDLFTAGPGAAEEGRKRLRRRALRQGWLLRRRYEGHPVPDAPTSPGENARVLPPPHVRVPEEQIANPLRRTRRLYAGDPLPRHLGVSGRGILQESIRDLAHLTEVRELGTAVFIDRPLGVFKAVGEPDQTLLLAHEAFSRTVGGQRLELLGLDAELLPDPAEVEALAQRLRHLEVTGLPAAAIARPERAVVSLADARRVAEDYVILRTLPGGVNDFFEQFDLGPLASCCALDYLTPRQPVLIVRTASPGAGPEGVLTVFDAGMRRRMELEVNREEGYVTRRGQKFPSGGLCVLRAWDSAGHAHYPGLSLRAR